MLTLVTYLTVTIRQRWEAVQESRDRGSLSAEGVILAAGLILIALLVVAVFRSKIAAKLDSINLG
jgi:hypothetical protein